MRMRENTLAAENWKRIQNTNEMYAMGCGWRWFAFSEN